MKTKQNRTNFPPSPALHMLLCLLEPRLRVREAHLELHAAVALEAPHDVVARERNARTSARAPDRCPGSNGLGTVTNPLPIFEATEGTLTGDRFRDDGDKISGVEGSYDEECKVDMRRTFLPINPGNFSGSQRRKWEESWDLEKESVDRKSKCSHHENGEVLGRHIWLCKCHMGPKPRQPYEKFK
ncbi:hypothetical protein C8J57DRAFT_1243402 [Mycena rebaudengoi]|nr:hypothetical protein C8J57DRAFT_1243402 [Mycena rebaudengoi]